MLRQCACGLRLCSLRPLHKVRPARSTVAGALSCPQRSTVWRGHGAKTRPRDEGAGDELLCSEALPLRWRSGETCDSAQSVKRALTCARGRRNLGRRGAWVASQDVHAHFETDSAPLSVHVCGLALQDAMLAAGQRAVCQVCVDLCQRTAKSEAVRVVSLYTRAL